jgi:hypothetical protein
LRLVATTARRAEIRLALLESRSEKATRTPCPWGGRATLPKRIDTSKVRIDARADAIVPDTACAPKPFPAALDRRPTTGRLQLPGGPVA